VRAASTGEQTSSRVRRVQPRARTAHASWLATMPPARDDALRPRLSSAGAREGGGSAQYTHHFDVRHREVREPSGSDVSLSSRHKRHRRNGGPDCGASLLTNCGRALPKKMASLAFLLLAQTDY
jgi:hypothetical protein